MTDPILDVLLPVARALEAVGAPYFVGGSVASSLVGEPRATNDIDFVVDLRPDQVAPFARQLGPDFEVDEPSLLEAVRIRRAWNIYFLPVFWKVDLILRGDSEYDQVELARRRRWVLAGDQGAFFIKSPEDTILRKLLWYLEGGETSTSQWRDVVGVLRVSSGRLEEPYLDEWAPRLGTAALLARARDEARLLRPVSPR